MSFTGHLFLGLLEGVVSGLVIALTAMGLSLVFGVMRIVNVAHGESFMLGAVFAWYFSSLTGSFYPALVAAPDHRGHGCPARRPLHPSADPLRARTDHRGHDRPAVYPATTRADLLRTLRAAGGRADLLPRGLSLVRVFRLQTRRRRAGGAVAGGALARGAEDAALALYSRHTAGPRNRAGLRRADRARLALRGRARRPPGRDRRR